MGQFLVGTAGRGGAATGAAKSEPCDFGRGVPMYQRPTPGLIRHTDRDVPHASAEDVARLARAGAWPSMSATGDPHDHAKNVIVHFLRVSRSAQ